MHLLERSIVDAEQVFNMDESGFRQSQRTKKVVEVYGSKNEWSKLSRLIAM